MMTLSRAPVKSPIFPQADKFFHAILFGVLAYFLSRSFSASGANRPFTAIILSSAYGALTEFGQLFVPGRHADIFDFFSDAFGAIVVIVIIQLRKDAR